MALRNKQRYDLKVRESILQAGDRVLVKNVGIRGKHKIADKWSQTVYKVVRHISDSPVYVVAPLTSEGPERTLHRDLLLPCGFLAPSNSVEADKIGLDGWEETTAKPTQNPAPEAKGAGSRLDSDEEEELDYPLVNQDKATYPSFTVVYDIPRTKTKPPLQLDVNPVGSDLNPTAEEFHPPQVVREEHSNTFQVPSVEAEEDNNLPADPLPGDETNLPVEEIEQSATVPLEEDLTVPNEPVNKGPGIDNAELQNQNQRAMREENERDNVGEEIGLTDTSSVQDETEPEARWPTRARREPDRLAYKSLGNPLTLVMRSILHSLDQVFTEALDLPKVPSPSPSPYTSRVFDV
ncbi:uncharacterized protein LOC115589810 [Sparus aurata]|nr:uncharacterized protein LOC115589810 [Sparus aurata]